MIAETRAAGTKSARAQVNERRRMTAETHENAQLRRRDARNRNGGYRKPILFDGKRQKDRRATNAKARTGTLSRRTSANSRGIETLLHCRDAQLLCLRNTASSLQTAIAVTDCGKRFSLRFNDCGNPRRRNKKRTRSSERTAADDRRKPRERSTPATRCAE